MVVVVVGVSTTTRKKEKKEQKKNSRVFLSLKIMIFYCHFRLQSFHKSASLKGIQNGPYFLSPFFFFFAGWRECTVEASIFKNKNMTSS